MRICLVSREYPPETASGGIGTQAYAKAHGLAARGHEVQVLSASPDEQLHDHEDGRVAVRRIPGVYPRLPVYTDAADWLAYSTEVAVSLAELQAERSFDVVEFAEWGGEGYVHLLNRTEWNELPAVVQLHGPIVMFAHATGWPTLDSDLYRVGTELERTCIRLADAVYSSSACSTRWAAEHYGLDAARVPTLHTGVDTEAFRPSATRDARPTIVFAGRLTGDKGVFHLLDAAVEVAARVPGLRVRLLGRGDDGDELARRIARLPEGTVELPGFVDRAELPGALARAHVFAAPSVYEPGPGLVNLEAMACGLPVIACAGAGAAEAVEDGVTGVLVPPADPGALAAALIELLLDETRREELGENARAAAVGRFDTERCIDEIEAFYAGVVAEAVAA